MSITQYNNSDNEPESFEAKIGSTQSIQTPVRGTELPISLLGVLSKIKIAQKRKKMFARQQEILAQCAIEAML
tara:strand:+ start:515 stop:733 length:219 start_codon:yes stop_codon:yes gene_type:complete